MNNKAIRDLAPGESFILDNNGTVYRATYVRAGGPGEGTRVNYVIPGVKGEFTFNRPSLTYVEIVSN